MALTFKEDMHTVHSDTWVKIADAGQRYLLQVESNGRNVMKIKSFATEQVAANIPKAGGTLLSSGETVTQDEFDGYVYILSNDNSSCRYNLHREE